MADLVVMLPIIAPPTPPPSRPLSDATLGLLLGALASRPGPVPKYQYPSAGTLYPVQAYVVLRQPLDGLSAGCHYYDPIEHALAPLSGATPPAPDGTAPDALLLLVAKYAAIEPIYGKETNRFCLLEAGYMAEALASAGLASAGLASAGLTSAGLALREAGDPVGHAALAAGLLLESDHVPLVCWAIGESA